jgi:murein DD-endopeptidase MepM/ murein hydrolase activator NlpD
MSYFDTHSSRSDPREVAAVIDMGTAGSDNPQSLEIQPAARTIDPVALAAQLAASQQVANQSGGETFARPASGAVVASFGGQYGTFHYGIEIQNQKDSPIYAAADGTITAAGPVSGFGLWVKEQLSDGTTLVYARLDDYSVQVGQRVTAGQQIARMGDQGFARTEPTLHFEVWDPNGKKIDPQGWLSSRGVTL